LIASRSKSLSVWSVEPVRPKQHRDPDDNQEGAPQIHHHQTSSYLKDTIGQCPHIEPNRDSQSDK